MRNRQQSTSSNHNLVYFVLSKVVELEDVPKYWIGLFEAIRRLRREGSHLSEPSTEEIRAIERAYELAPDSRAVLQGMATHNHDIYKKVSQCKKRRIPIPSSFDFLNNQNEFQAFVLRMKNFAR